jgi:hypothetical protein
MNINSKFHTIVTQAFSKVNREGLGFITNEISKAIANVERTYDKLMLPTSNNVNVVSEQTYILYYQAISMAFDKVNKEGLGMFKSYIQKAALDVTLAYFNSVEEGYIYVNYLERVYINEPNTYFVSPDSRTHIYQAIHNMILDGISKADIVNGFGGNPRPTELMYDAFIETNNKPIAKVPKTLNVFNRAKALSKLRR